MRTKTAPTIRLKNYKPPQYTIDNVDLTFRLEPEKTRVKSSLKVKRGSETAAGTELQLDGDELKLVSVAVDGRTLKRSEYRQSPQKLVLKRPPETLVFEIEIETEVAPKGNTKLMGLYLTNGVYCTQCEAEGFRRITYFPDRPDVLATYDVRIEAPKETCPTLLSNGNPGKAGMLDNDWHFAEWHDPHPKPSYLFALVAGALDRLGDTFTTMSGREVALNIFVEKGKAALAHYAMDALKRSMTWDEEVYGREYDLDVFNIVAVSDFNMGAMENKGLNVFNDKYVLANDELATDTDYELIEAIIAHEYFHNWTGNRITCRDWFQLCLKEGLTVYRDQEFSADMRSRGVQRIAQVRMLKAGQFPEDAGPLAHPVRPKSYKEINNFYTATVYQKGAELVRMLATIVGDETYRKATDLYFERHDGEAAIVEDFLKCFEDAAGIDLAQFSRWYEQAGTPIVTVRDTYNAVTGKLTLDISQRTPPTQGQARKMPVVIPIRFGFLDAVGNELNVTTSCPDVRDDIIVLNKARSKVEFDGLSSKPVLSLLRGFSAPVNLEHDEPEEAALTRAAADTDPYNRWQAINGLALKVMKTGPQKPGLPLLEAIEKTAMDAGLEPDFRAQVLTFPTEQDIAREIGKDVNPGKVVASRFAFVEATGRHLASHCLDLIAECQRNSRDATTLDAGGWRALQNALLQIAIAGGLEGAKQVALDITRQADNMTEHFGALTSLVLNAADDGLTGQALDTFYTRFENHPLVIDKWFALQAAAGGSAGIQRIERLLQHPAYTLENPNRARSVLGAFASRNMISFHDADGRGYRLFTDRILALDDINPQLAARLLTLMNNWRSFDETRRNNAQQVFEEIAETKNLSVDTREIVERFLT